MGVRYTEEPNILRRLCFILGWSAGLAAGVACADDLSVQPQHITSVVRPDVRTGRLVRSTIVTPRLVPEQRVTENVVAPRQVSPAPPAAEQPGPPTGINEAVDRIAARNLLPATLIHSVIKVESNYNPFAVSPKGAQGLMQLIPATARRFGVGDVFNPVENIQGGAKYLKYLLDLYHNDIALALAAYNAGEAAVAKYGTVPPFRETQNYLQLIADQLKKTKAAGAAVNHPQPVKPAETEPAGPNHIRKVVDPDGTVRYVTR
jgi:soluble lytic murein transglycosylase-like protein